MRRLILQMNISTDGFVAGPDGELDWMTPGMDEKQVRLLNELTEGMDTIIMGSGMADGFISHWENVVDHQPDDPEHTFARIFVDTPKVVFSRSGWKQKGKNVRVENSDLVESIKELKKKPGKDIIVYGGARFVSALLEHGLIDELYLFVNPVALGQGLAIFNKRCLLKVKEVMLYENGVVGNHCQVNPA